MARARDKWEYGDEELANLLLARVREEFTVMPRFGYHQPLDYHTLTLPPVFADPSMAGESVASIDPESGLAVPSSRYRFGYSPEDAAHYLAWGKYDHDELVAVFNSHRPETTGMSLLDLGCSSGRVLRHFHNEWRAADWRLHGCDIQALPIEWMRYHFPSHFMVTATSVLPHLPFEDRSFDFIYGISVFTHIKYLWDAWLLELKRVLKPGGLMVQTIHAETAWEFYHAHRHEEWIRSSQPARVFDTPKMDVDFLQYGDMAVSQVFWRRDIARKYWGRYFSVLR